MFLHIPPSIASIPGVILNRETQETQGNPRKPEKTQGNPKKPEETQDDLAILPSEKSRKPRKPKETQGNPGKPGETRVNPRKPKMI